MGGNDEGWKRKTEKKRDTLSRSPMSFPKLRLPGECSNVQNPSKTPLTQVDTVGVCVYMPVLMFSV